MDIVILLLASIATGVVYILDKRISDSEHKADTFAFLTSIINALISIPLLFINFYISSDIWIWIMILLSGATFGLSRYFIYKAYQKTDASIVSIIHKSNLVLGAIFGIILFNEQFSGFAYIGIFLITLSSIFILYKGGRISIDKGVLYAFIMAVLTSIAAILDKAILKDFSAYTYVFVNCVATAIIFIFQKGIIKNSIRMFRNKPGYLLSRSILNTASWTAYIVVLQNTTLSKTFPIYKSLSLLVPVILGITLLKEKNQLWQKIFGMILGIIGIILVAYF